MKHDWQYGMLGFNPAGGFGQCRACGQRRSTAWGYADQSENVTWVTGPGPRRRPTPEDNVCSGSKPSDVSPVELMPAPVVLP